MDTWQLPLAQARFYLAADARLPAPAQEPEGDVVWVLAQRQTLPLAPALETQLGLQVQYLALFPLFAEGPELPWRVDVGEYARPPQLIALLPDYAHLHARPFPWLEVEWEIWVPSGITVVGRVRWRHIGTTAQTLRWGWAGLLRPLREGAPFEPRTRKAITYLVGRTPVGRALLYMTGGPQGILSPYPALVLTHRLKPQENHTFTWVWTLAQDEEEGLTRARRWAAQPWEAHKARRDLMDAQLPRVLTGQPPLDYVLLRGRQRAPHFLVRTPKAGRPYPVVHRHPEDNRLHPEAPEDIPDFPELWYWVTQYGLPGVQDWVRPTVELLLGVRNRHGHLDGRPAAWGAEGQYLAHPLVVDLVWRIHQVWQDRNYLARVLPALGEWLQAWFSPQHDRDRDGWPEWEHLTQTGLPLLPAFSPWHPWSTGQDLNTVESPALLALLYRACDQVAELARAVGRQDLVHQAEQRREDLKALWDRHLGTGRHLPSYRDRDTHHTHRGRRLWHHRGEAEATFEPPLTLDPPTRVVLHVLPHAARPRELHIRLWGRDAQGRALHLDLQARHFRWVEARGLHTTASPFARLEGIHLRGLHRRDRVVLMTSDLTRKDLSLLAGLWAGLVSPKTARAWADRYLEDARQGFLRPGGWSLMPGRRPPEEGHSVVLWWNTLLLEGLMRVGERERAARHLLRLLQFQSRMLDQEGAFFAVYHGETGRGLGRGDIMAGLPPLGLVLELAGMQFLPGMRVRFRQPSAFQQSITVHIWGSRVRREPKGTEVRFAWGETRRFPPDVRGVLSLRQGQMVEP